MSYITRHRLPLPVSATGAGATQSFDTQRLFGQLEAIVLTRATASGLSTNANLTIQTQQSGQVVLNVTATGNRAWYPRALAESTGGAVRPAVASADTSAGFPVKFPVANEPLRVTVTSGGASVGPGGALSTGNFLDFYISGA